MINTYNEAETYLAQGRDKNSRPVANNTRVERRDDGIAVRLHATDVATIHPDDSITLNSGGWLTVTTKDRMNNALGRRARIASEKGVWFVYKPGWESKSRYFDGIRVASDGTVLNPMPIEDVARKAKAEAAMAKRIRSFVSGYMKALDEGMPTPSGGDCWDCSFVTQDGKSMGDTKNDQIHGHLFSHMTDKYFVPTLIWNAMRERGYRDVVVVMGMNLDYSLYEQGTMRIRRAWQSDAADPYITKSFRAALTKYLAKRLIKSRAH